MKSKAHKWDGEPSCHLPEAPQCPPPREAQDPPSVLLFWDNLCF